MFASLAKPDDDTELHWLKVCSPPRYPLFFHPAYRMAKHDALPARSSPPYTTSKIPRTATRTPAFSYFRILACVPKAATVSNSVSLKSSGASVPFALAYFSYPTAIPFVTASPFIRLRFMSTLQKSFLAWKVGCFRHNFVLSELSSLCPRFVRSFIGFRIITLFRLRRRLSSTTTPIHVFFRIDPPLVFPR